MTSKLNRLVSLLAAAPFLFAATAHAQTPPAPSGDPIAIGFDAPLSRPGDVGQGQQMQQGADLGIEYVNTVMGGALGRPLKLALHDDGGKPDVAVTGYRRLVSEEKVPIVVGYYHSSTALGVAEVAKEIGVPILVTAASAAAITEARNPLVFRTLATDENKIAMISGFIDDKGFKKVTLLADNTDYGTGLIKRLKDATDSNPNISVDYKVFDAKAADLTSLLLSVKASSPDLVIAGSTGAANHLILDQGTTIGLFPGTPFLFADTTPTGPTYWELHPANGVGPYYVLFYSPKSGLSEAGQWMVDEFRKRHDLVPTYAAINSFGNVLIAAQAIQQAGSTDPAGVVSALNSGTFSSWNVKEATFPAAEGVNFQQWNVPMALVQMTEQGQNWYESPIIFSGE